MSLFKKSSNNKITIDWPHQYIVHEVLHGTPSATMSSGEYRTVSEDDFQDSIAKVKEVLPEIDINADSTHIFDAILRSREAELLCDLTETRLLHIRDSIRLRTDVEKEYRIHVERIRRLEEKRAELMQERNLLTQID